MCAQFAGSQFTMVVVLTGAWSNTFASNGEAAVSLLDSFCNALKGVDIYCMLVDMVYVP